MSNSGKESSSPPADQTQTACVRQRPSAKNQFDNKANFRYLGDYSFRLMDASIFNLKMDIVLVIVLLLWQRFIRQIRRLGS
jgi:hypothetical protein